MFPEGGIEGGLGIEPCIEGDPDDRQVAVFWRTQESLRFPYAILVDKIEEALVRLSVDHLGQMMGRYGKSGGKLRQREFRLKIRLLCFHEQEESANDLRCPLIGKP